jgi:hypothetical protein
MSATHMPAPIPPTVKAAPVATIVVVAIAVAVAVACSASTARNEIALPGRDDEHMDIKSMAAINDEVMVLVQNYTDEEDSVASSPYIPFPKQNKRSSVATIGARKRGEKIPGAWWYSVQWTSLSF